MLLFAGCVLAAALLAAATQFRETHRNDLDKASVAHAERERWLNQGVKDPHSAAHYSIYAFKPSAALSMLDGGIESYVGQTVRLEAHVQNDLLYRPKGEATLLERAGSIGPSALLVLLAPLVAFLLAYFVVAAERDRGTFALALSNARSPQRLMLFRALLLWLIVSLVLVVPVALIAGGSALARGVFDLDVGVRLAIWTMVFVAYAGLLVFAGLAVVLRVRDVRPAMLALFGLWALLIAIAPRALASAVEVTRPLPSTESIKTQMETEAPSYWGVEVSDARLASLLQQYGVSRKQDLPVDERGSQLDAAEKHSHEVFDRVLGDFYDRVEAQDRLFGDLGWLSPAIAAQSLSALLAGTDFHHHRPFIDAAEHYRRALVNRMNAELVTRPLNDGEARYTAGAQLWAQVLQFTFTRPVAVGRAAVGRRPGACLVRVAHRRPRWRSLSRVERCSHERCFVLDVDGVGAAATRALEAVVVDPRDPRRDVRLGRAKRSGFAGRAGKGSRGFAPSRAGVAERCDRARPEVSRRLRYAACVLAGPDARGGVQPVFPPHPQLPAAFAAVGARGGASDLLPDRQRIKLATLFGSEDAYDFQNPRGLALGRFDLSFVVTNLLPVAIVLLTVLLCTYVSGIGACCGSLPRSPSALGDGFSRASRRLRC